MLAVHPDDAFRVSCLLRVGAAHARVEQSRFDVATADARTIAHVEALAAGGAECLRLALEIEHAVARATYLRFVAETEIQQAIDRGVDDAFPSNTTASVKE